jgi:hypothetical protein
MVIRRYSKAEMAQKSELFFPEERRREFTHLAWDGKSFRHFADPKVVCIEHFTRDKKSETALSSVHESGLGQRTHAQEARAAPAAAGALSRNLEKGLAIALTPFSDEVVNYSRRPLFLASNSKWPPRQTKCSATARRSLTQRHANGIPRSHAAVEKRLALAAACSRCRNPKGDATMPHTYPPTRSPCDDKGEALPNKLERLVRYHIVQSGNREERPVRPCGRTAWQRPLSGVDSKDSLLRSNQIQGFFLGGGLAN